MTLPQALKFFEAHPDKNSRHIKLKPEWSGEIRNVYNAGWMSTYSTNVSHTTFTHLSCVKTGEFELYDWPPPGKSSYQIFGPVMFRRAVPGEGELAAAGNLAELEKILGPATSAFGADSDDGVNAVLVTSWTLFSLEGDSTLQFVCVRVQCMVPVPQGFDFAAKKEAALLAAVMARPHAEAIVKSIRVYSGAFHPDR